MDQRVIVASETEQTEAQSSPNTLWNEGRVVGYSAYEVYVRQHLLEDPMTEPASEREWLASSLASGASLLVHIPKTSKAAGVNWVQEISLPEGTQLCAANTIVASLFYGTGKDEDGHNFANYVDSYGDLIDRAVMLNSTETLPQSSDLKENGWLRKVRSYLHIFDGVVIQPGTWFKNDEGEIDFIPKLKATKEGEDIRPKIRLHIRGPIDDSFWIVLSGFTMRNIASGTTKTTAVGPEYDEAGDVYQKTFESSIKSIHPENGDFLGPEMYPWANKVIFSVPSQAATSPLFQSTVTGIKQAINETPIIDLKHCNPGSYYGSEYANAKYNNSKINELVTVQEINELVTVQDGVAVLATHQRSSAFAPALYASLYGKYSVDEDTASTLYPIDTVAPRTIKFFHGEEALAKQFEQDIPYNFALVRRNDNYILQQIRWVNGVAEVLPVADSDVLKSGDQYHMRTLHGTESKLRAVALTKDDGTLLSQTGGSGTTVLEDDKLNWKILLDALGLDKQIDVLGEGLREFKKLIVDIFEGRGIRDEAAQYAVKVKEDGDNYSIYFEEIEIPNPVGFDVSESSPYILTITSTDNQGATYRYKTISLSDSEDNTAQLLAMNGDDGELSIEDDKLTWQRLLDALGQNQHIRLVGPELVQFKSALGGLSAGKKYVLVLDKEGNPKFQTLEDVNIPEFPSYVLESIKCVPTYHSQGYHADTIVLDVFGYVSTNRSFNTFATLTHTRPTGTNPKPWHTPDGYGKYGIVQPFTIQSDTAKSAWLRICQAMAEAGTLKASSRKVIFTSGGRPMYYSTKESPDKRRINAPSSMLSIVAYIQPIEYKNGNYYRYGTDDIATSIPGMIIWTDYHQSMSWASAPSGGSYTGALVGDDEEPDTWYPDFRWYTI